MYYKIIVNNVYIDFIGLVIITILYRYCYKRISENLNYIFAKFIILLGAIMSLDGVGYILLAEPFSYSPLANVCAYVISNIIVISECFLGISWCMYTREVFFPARPRNVIAMIFIHTPIVCVVTLIVIGILQRDIVNYNYSTGFLRGRFFWIFFLFYLPHIIYVFAVLFMSFRRKNKLELVRLFFVSQLLLIIALTTQIFVASIPILFISFALILLNINMRAYALVGEQTEQQSKVFVHTFGRFYLMFGNEVVKFKRTKSLELIAYLVDKKGAPVSVSELIYELYETDEITKTHRSSIHNLFSDIKTVTECLGINNLIIKDYNSARVNNEIILCDYYNFLSGNEQAVHAFSGEYMTQYSWAEETCGYLWSAKQKKI